MAGPLHGVKILDMTSMISGPTTTLILADQGAEVIKVENPNFGDHTRIVSCLLYTSPSPRDLSTSRMPSSA